MERPLLVVSRVFKTSIQETSMDNSSHNNNNTRDNSIRTVLSRPLGDPQVVY